MARLKSWSNWPSYLSYLESLDSLVDGVLEAHALHAVVDLAVQHADPADGGLVGHAHPADLVVGGHGDFAGAPRPVGVGDAVDAVVARHGIGVALDAAVVVVADLGILKVEAKVIC